MTTIDEFDNLEKFGYEQDPNIEVTITGIEDEFCFLIKVGEKSFRLHARSLLDLIRKSHLSLLDWEGLSATSILESRE